MCDTNKQPNAMSELLGAAGATQERTLFPVSSTQLFGPVCRDLAVCLAQGPSQGPKQPRGLSLGRLLYA